MPLRLFYFCLLNSLVLLSVCPTEDCTNGSDDDGDGLIDLNDPDCSCNPATTSPGPELIFNGGFEIIDQDNPDCEGCISLFNSDNCPLGWVQESVNLHTPCYLNQVPAENIGYLNSSSNYQGIGGYGTDTGAVRIQLEFLQATLLHPLEAGQLYRFSGSFGLPVATAPGINLSSEHRLVILGSTMDANAINSVGSGCYEDRPGWTTLGYLDIINNALNNLRVYQTTFTVFEPISTIVIASACCQPVSPPSGERLTYFGADNISLRSAELAPRQDSIQLFANDCALPIILAFNSVPGVNYQWYAAGVAIPGATTNHLELPSNTADGSSYQLRVSDATNCAVYHKVIFRACNFLSEICDNGIDDDGNGLIDLNDPACDCPGPQLSLSDSIVSNCPAEILLAVTTPNAQNYQWYYNGQPVIEATRDTFRIDANADLFGQYQVVINQGSSCTISEVYQPTPDASLAINWTTEVARCFRDSSGIIRVEPINGPPLTYTYEWYNELGDLISNNQEVIGLEAGNYRLQLTAPNGCSGNFGFSLNDPLPPGVIPVIEPPNCHSASRLTEVTLTPFNLQPPLVFSYFDSNENPLPLAGAINSFEPGSYFGEVIDNNGCRARWGPVDLNNENPVSINISAQETLLQLGQSTRVMIDFLAPGLVFDGWSSTATPVDCDHCENLLFTPTASTSLFATAIDIVNGCTYTDSITISVIGNRQVFFPNAFSPNFDGINDQWKIFPGPAVTEIGILKIFSRWGDELFSGPGQVGWAGRTQAGRTVSPGVYIYRVELIFLDGDRRFFSGSIMVLK